MPSEHSRSSSSSSATSVPTINVKYAPPPLKNATNKTNSTYNNEMLDISNGSSREKSPSRDRNSRGKSPGRNNKRGKSPSLDPPKSPNSNRSRSPGNRSRSKSPRNKTENESPRNNKSSQDVRVSLNLKAPWISPSLKESNTGKGSSSKSSNRLSLPQNFSEFNMNAIRESNERWERLNNISSDSKSGGKSGMGNFSKPVPLRIGSIIRPKLIIDTNNNLQGGKPMQRNPSGQLTGKLNDSPLLPAAGPPPLTRSRSYNSAMDDTNRVPTFSKDLEQHRLQHSWTMYYDSKPAMTPGPKTPTGEISYKENLQTIGTFDTVERFCRYFNWVKKPSQLNQNTNFHIFKDKIMPLWEDPANANGGKWVISLKNPQLLDRCWEWLVYSLVGEQLDENDDICGAVMSRRPRGDRIAIWVRDKDNAPVINGIGRRLLKILDLQNENSIGMDFQINEDALKSGTSYNNHVYLSLESLKAEKDNLEELSKVEKINDEVDKNIPETKAEKSNDKVDKNIPETKVEKSNDGVDENIPETKVEKSKDEVDKNIPETPETKIEEVTVKNDVATDVDVSISGEEKNHEKENEKN